MLWYLTYPFAFENFVVLWYLTNSGVKRNSSQKNKGQNRQLTWAIGSEKCKFPIKSGLMLSLWKKGETAWTSNSTGSAAPQSLVYISPYFLTLPSPSSLSSEATRPPRGKSCYGQCCPEDQSTFLEWQARTTTLSLVEICWRESSLQWCHAACRCNPSNNWLGKFLFQTI